MPSLNIHMAQQFPTSFNLLQLDRAGAHIATQLQWPANVMPVFQPPASPERGSHRALVAGAQSSVQEVEFCQLGSVAAVAVSPAGESLEPRDSFADQPKLHSPGGPDVQ